MPKHILITGGTGALGRCMVRALLHQSDASLVLLVRQSDGIASVPELLDAYLQMEPTRQLVHRIRIVHGDVLQPGMGVAESDGAMLQASVDAIIHAAAMTRFDEKREVCQAINVAGTQEVLRWARHCARIDRIAFLSTAYVSGRRTGLILENDRVHDAGFVNPYEESKYDAEAVIERAQRDLPISIYRMSTILGDSVTGKVDRFAAPHFTLRLLWLGLVPMVPGTPDFAVELLPSDYAARTVAALFLEHFSPGQRFHIVAGPDRCWTLDHLIDVARDTFAALNPGWEHRGYPKPSLVDAETYRLFIRTVEEAGNPLFRQVLTQLHSFSEQLLCPKRFDARNLTAAIPDYLQRLPRLEEYFPKVLAYCVRNDWT
jgi:thioester reductase-like protein